MKQNNKKMYTVAGIVCIVAGIAGLIFGNYIMTGLPILGAFTAVAGFIMVAYGTVKNDDLGVAEPVEAARKVEVTIKADNLTTKAGCAHNDGIYHGV